MIVWRTWAYQTLTNGSNLGEFEEELKDAVFGAGSLKGSPSQRPFIVVRMGPKIPTPVPGTSSDELVVAVHDEPGDYLRINTLLDLVRSALEGPVAQEGAIAARWTGESGDLADEGYGTIFRTNSFQCVGRTE